MKLPILCLDFDGVIHAYTSKWTKADEIHDGPVGGACAFIIRAQQHFRVVIYSSRSCQPGGLRAMKKWLEAAFWDHFDDGDGLSPKQMSEVAAILAGIEWPLEKPPAHVILDDRALNFAGTWPEMDDLIHFKPWNKR